MKTKELWDAVGGLGNASKMPWFTYGLPASKCRVGSILRKMEGTVCSICFACKGRYNFDNVQNAQFRRWSIVTKHERIWTLYMIELLHRKSKGKVKHFRWFDSGDLHSRSQLKAIIGIAHALPNIKFWLPTKERAMLDSIKGMKLPDNLIIRVSAPMIGQVIPAGRYNTSSVDAEYGFKCPASRGEVTCDGAKCRACWDKTVENIDYAAH